MEEPRLGHPHLDGMFTPANGVTQGTIANFTMLIAVFLSDIPHGFMGNFTAWPGSHRLYEDYFRQHGPQSLLSGLPPVALPEPQQITGQAGDAVFCHYQLAHCVSGNGSPFPRYAIFFRLKHRNHETLHWECMTDIWREWAGMQDVVNV
jgi:ectoine hydroxylase-related dioxygenase (phytanoyl-CoA dioxygenase family)